MAVEARRESFGQPVSAPFWTRRLGPCVCATDPAAAAPGCGASRPGHSSPFRGMLLSALSSGETGMPPGSSRAVRDCHSGSPHWLAALRVAREHVPLRYLILAASDCSPGPVALLPSLRDACVGVPVPRADQVGRSSAAGPPAKAITPARPSLQHPRGRPGTTGLLRNPEATLEHTRPHPAPWHGRAALHRGDGRHAVDGAPPRALPSSGEHQRGRGV